MRVRKIGNFTGDAAKSFLKIVAVTFFSVQNEFTSIQFEVPKRRTKHKSCKTKNTLI